MESDFIKFLWKVVSCEKLIINHFFEGSDQFIQHYKPLITYPLLLLHRISWDYINTSLHRHLSFLFYNSFRWKNQFVMINKLLSNVPLVNDSIVFYFEGLNMLQKFLGSHRFEKSYSRILTCLKPMELNFDLGTPYFICLINL